MPAMDRLPTRLGLFAAALLVACSGCSTLLTAAYVLMPEDTPAEFKGLKGLKALKEFKVHKAFKV